MAEVMDVLRNLQKDFFCLASSNDFTHQQNVDIIIYDYDDYFKLVMIVNHINVPYVGETDVQEFLNIDIALLSNGLSFLENLIFCMYFFNVLEILKNSLNTNKTILSEMSNNEVSIVFLPCKHTICCTECAQKLEKSCICLEKIMGVLRLYIS